jgi:hypothetical protein
MTTGEPHVHHFIPSFYPAQWATQPASGTGVQSRPQGSSLEQAEAGAGSMTHPSIRLRRRIDYSQRAAVSDNSQVFAPGVITSRARLALCAVRKKHICREAYMRVLLKVLLALSLVSMTISTASAQRQPTTCSGGRQACKEQITRRGTMNADACDAAFAQCMKSGIFTGPMTHTSWPVTKK